MLKSLWDHVKPKRSYPKSIFFILGNEFCERFTYYGLRTILTIYLTQRLFYSENAGTIIFHLFSMLAYFTPVLGAIIADSLLGKFKTILYVSILYTIGGIVLSVGSFPFELSTMKIVSLIGLFIIGVGTGGIKPCVSAFGGDQFEEGQEKQLKNFFSVFYFAINLGSVFSTILTPILREDIKCFGERTCFPAAFGVPSILMVFAVLLFAVGRPLYKVRPPEGNIALKVLKCTCYAISKKCHSTEKKSEKKSHWLDRAEDKFDKKLIEEIKVLMNVLFLYIPLPLFWALFDQQASRWTLQATRMDGLVGGFHIKADQMQVINPFLIVSFIPVFNYVVYPILDKCYLLRKPLQRITTGGVLAGLSFIIAGFIELYLESYLPVMPQPGHSHLEIINNSPCSVRIAESNISMIPPFTTGIEEDLIFDKNYAWNFQPDGCSVSTARDFSFNASDSIGTMMITVANSSLVVRTINDTKEKSHTGEPQIRLIYNIDPPTDGSNITFRFHREIGETNHYIYTESVETIGISNYTLLPPGNYKIYLPISETDYEEIPVLLQHFRSGGNYIVSIYSKKAEGKNETSVYEMVKGNHVSILLQIPQYAIITAGEIMFSITGLEFSYNQSPKSMKSVIQSAWLMTVAFGNLIVLIIAKIEIFARQSSELFLFAALMFVDMVAFSILAYLYKPVHISLDNSDEPEEPSASGRSNEGYVDETDFNK